MKKHVHIHGAEIDIVAQSKSDPFAPTIYIEATIEYVDNTKYGKDATKYLLVKNKESSCVCLCISSKGFTAEVIERATNSNIRTLTYNELFRSFEMFAPYVEKILNDRELESFDSMYEEPFFEDAKGRDQATNWLVDWARGETEASNWIIVLGEYGTGKTALTRVLQRRLLKNYHELPNEKIPLRIELRDFSRQFDSRTLLHHFLDTNGLSHIPIDFLLQLIRTGRVILLLDGYDEMAQFLNVRERRACLGALADLASGGAKGILTSRPNYFNETEELRVFEALYKLLEDHNYHISSADKTYFQAEKDVDSMIVNYILERYERILRDLTEEQTESLVVRKLTNDLEGQRVILSILKSVFRTAADGVKQSLSGKPVIITYLLDLVDDIKGRPAEMQLPLLDEWTEWRVYKMIIDRLMIRDQQRTPGIVPVVRRDCLRQLAIILSQRDVRVAADEVFYNIIDRQFRAELRGIDAEQRIIRRNELFENLRTSATLTRSEDKTKSGWSFSHNSLREYLATEFYITSIESKSFADITIPISAPMRAFVASMEEGEIMQFTNLLAGAWPTREIKNSLGGYLTLLWDAFAKVGVGKKVDLALKRIGGGSVRFDSVRLRDVELSELNISEGNIVINGCKGDFSEIVFRKLDLSGSDFREALLDTVSFIDCDLRNVKFDRALIYECVFYSNDLSGSSFIELAEKPVIFVRDGDSRICLRENYAIGYLKFYGAKVDSVDDYYVYCNHPKYSIVYKICERLSEQKWRQIRGLTQRGEAHKDTRFARDFVDLLIKHQVIEEARRGIVGATAPGKQLLMEFVQGGDMPSFIVEYMISS